MLARAFFGVALAPALHKWPAVRVRAQHYECHAVREGMGRAWLPSKATGVRLAECARRLSAALGSRSEPFAATVVVCRARRKPGWLQPCARAC